MGEGTKESPIIVNPGRNLPLKLILSKSQLYLTLRNLTLTSLTLYRCKHISIEECKVNILVLKRCQENTVKNSSIIRIESFLSRANNFENNHIFNVLSHRLEKIGYKILLFFALFFSCLMVYSGIRRLVNQEAHLISFYLLILGTLVISALSYYLILEFKMRKLKPNVFKDNFSMTCLSQLFIN